MSEFFGKYRGKVENNVDDAGKIGRIEVSVPTVLGEGNLTWAMPCVPYAGPGVGFFAIPPEGANVWIEFEEGDLQRPIWTGCFWEEDQVPVNDYTVEKKVLKTGVGTITLNDSDDEGGITIETSDDMKIVINSNGIEIDNGQGGKINLTGNTVSINDNALEVT